MKKNDIKNLRRIVTFLKPPEESLKEFEKELVELHVKSYDNYDKKITYISSSAIGLSVVFADKYSEAINNYLFAVLLILSWIFFTVTLCLNLFSHTYTAKKHFDTLSEIRNNLYNQQSAELRNSKINKYNKIVNWIFIAGICCIMLFFTLITFNMIKKTPDKSKTELVVTKVILKNQDTISIILSKVQRELRTEGTTSTPPPDTVKTPGTKAPANQVVNN